MLPYPNIDPVAVSLGPFSVAGRTIGPLEVHWYGLMYLFGFAAAWVLGVYRARRQPWAPVKAGQMEDLVFYGALGLIIGARVGYVVFYGLEAWSKDFWLLFKVWEGGMSFHGGLIGVMTAMLLFARKIRRNFVDIMDFIVPFCPLGIFFGRMGNFIGGELYGRITDVPWGMKFPGDPDNVRHPSQLYEAFLEGIVLFIILMWFSRKPRPRAAVSGLFLLGYGLFRFSVEFVREPDAHIQFDLFDWVTRGQLLSAPMIAAGAALLIWTYWQEPRRQQAAAAKAAASPAQKPAHKHKSSKASRRTGKPTGNKG